MERIKLPKKLKPLLTKKKRFKIIIGGRGSGKSHTVADLCIAAVASEGIKVGCFREFQNSISDSVHSLISEEIERLEIPGFEITNNAIKYHGDEAFTFKGLARNPESIKSMHGYKRFFVEEAQTISYKSLKLLTPTLREEDSEIWMVGNPGSSADPFSQRFITPYKKQLDKHGYYEDDLHLIIVCNYEDNPFFPQVLEEERAHDYIALDRAEYDHIWLGQFNDSVDNSIIRAEWFDAVIDAHKKLGFKPRGAVIGAHDPADNRDEKAIAIRKGSVFIDIQGTEDYDVNDACDWATGIAINHQSDLFTWDCDGLGLSLKRQVNDAFQGIKCEARMFKGSMAVDNPDAIYEPMDSIHRPKTNRESFKNKRSQYYWLLRDRFYKTYRAVVHGDYIDPDELISISSDIEDIAGLRSEVCRIPLKPNPNGLIQIMSKQEMWDKHQIQSPNRADAMMMSMEIPDPIDEFAPLNYQKMSIA